MSGYMWISLVTNWLFFVGSFQASGGFVHENEHSILDSSCSDTVIGKIGVTTDINERRLEEESSPIDLAHAKELTNKVANLVYQRFEWYDFSRFQFLLGSSSMPHYAWDILKYKFAKKIVDGESRFLMIFGGSSVTAGHDNYYHQSWPFVFERRMKPVFDALGVELIVRNIAQGANNCHPYIYCYEAMGGSDPDFIAWEQSFNCGRANNIFEMAARMAAYNKAVIYFASSGGFNPDGCPPSKDPIPWISEDWTPENSGLTGKEAEELEARGLHLTKDYLATFRTQMSEWHFSGNPVSKFTFRAYGQTYANAGPHGFGVWERQPMCNENKGCGPMDTLGPCHAQGGAHWMVKEASVFGKDGGTGAKHHPPAGMHLLRGELLVLSYASILMDAMLMVEETLAVQGSTRESASAVFAGELEKLQFPVPDPLYCVEWECKQPVYCYTDFTPHFNPQQQLSRMVVGEHPGWVRIVKPGAYTDPHKKYGYKDDRPMYEAQGDGSELYVRVSGVRKGLIQVCGYSVKNALKHVFFFLDKDAGNDLEPVQADAAADVLEKDGEAGPEDQLVEDRELHVSREIEGEGEREGEDDRKEAKAEEEEGGSETEQGEEDSAGEESLRADLESEDDKEEENSDEAGQEEVDRQGEEGEGDKGGDNERDNLDKRSNEEKEEEDKQVGKRGKSLKIGHRASSSGSIGSSGRKGVRGSSRSSSSSTAARSEEEPHGRQRRRRMEEFDAQLGRSDDSIRSRKGFAADGTGIITSGGSIEASATEQSKSEMISKLKKKQDQPQKTSTTTTAAAVSERAMSRGRVASARRGLEEASDVASGERGIPYTPSDDRVPLTNTVDRGDECLELQDIPPGDHVLTIKTDAANPHHRSAFTHLIVF